MNNKLSKLTALLLMFVMFFTIAPMTAFEVYAASDAGLLQRSSLPSAYNSDFNSLLYQTPVKNQGVNGMCWTFAACAAIESQMLMTGVGEDEPDLSELHMTHSASIYTGIEGSGDYESGNWEQGFAQGLSDGGSGLVAMAYLMRGGDLCGTVNEEDDPYDDYIENVIVPRLLSETKSKPKSYNVQNIRFFENEEDAIKSAILNYGAVSCGMYTGAEDENYFNEDNTAFYFNGEAHDISHAITVVGWDDNYSKDNFKEGARPSTDGAWLIKNSWGTFNRMAGYHWLSYEDTSAPVNPYAIDGVKPYDPELRVFEYDPLGFRGTILSSDTDEAYAANVFTVQTSGETLESVKVFTPEGMTNISVYIDPDFQEADSLDIGDALRVIANETLADPGYYTLDLPAAIALGAAGSQFAVIVKYDNALSEYDTLLPYEAEDNSIANAGESLFSETGTSNSWAYLQDAGKYYNFNIKAVTSPAVSSVVISPSTASVQRGTTQSFRATVYKGEKNLENAVTWGVSGSNSSSSISTDGVLSVATNETAKTLTVIAVSTHDLSKLATAQVTVTSGESASGSGSSSGGRSGDSGSSGNSISPPAGAETVDVIINGQTVKASVNKDGVLEITYSEDDLRSLAADSMLYEIVVTGQENIHLNIPITALTNEQLSIKTDFGVITIPSETLRAIESLYGGTLRLVITRGSFKVALVNSKGGELSYDDPDNPFTITLSYKLKSAEQSGAVVAVKKNGAVNTILPFAVYNDGIASFAVSSTGTYDLVYNAKTFHDISGHWASDDISFVTARELFAGTGDGNFTPDGSMTRAMFVTVLARLESADLSGYGAPGFDDVPSGEWYSQAVYWAADNGLISGVGNGRFDPHAEITREQMAVMLHNYYVFKGYVSGATSPRESFADEAEISAWAKEAVAVLKITGFINGKPGNIFDPKGKSTRAEATALFTRVIVSSRKL